MLKVLLAWLAVVAVVAVAHAQNRPPAPAVPPSVATPTSQGRRDAACLERNARYPVAGQCDAYVQCTNWVAEEMLCPEGLRYRLGAAPTDYPCGYPNEVACKERAALQPTRPTADCPHQFGFFRTGDASNCGVYRNCVGGKGYDFHCPEGLAYDSSSYRCEWPDLVTDCNAEAYVGFRCPEPAIGYDGKPLFVGNGFHKHERDCRKYYACVEGRPRLLSCEPGKAFDEYTAQCEDAETVTECAV